MPHYNPRTMKGRTLIRKMGGGSILLSKGGPGVGSSYDSLEDYKRVTGTGMCGTGSILSNKLKSLVVKPIKEMKKNIKFSL